MATETFIFELRTRGAKRSAADIRRIGKSANQVRKTLAFLRSALVVVASVRVFAGLVGVMANFADAMATVRAVTGATVSQFDRMRAAAKELGATTRFTATEAAEGMLALGRAGFTTGEIIATIPNTLALAQAGALELGKASEITAAALRAFRLDASEAERVVDVFTFTANNSLNTVLDLGEAFKTVAPVAAGLGISIEQLSAAFATLGNVNIRAGLAGRGLRRVITDLESPTGDLAKILDRLNISQEEVQVSAVGMQAAFKVLSDAGVGVTLAARAFGKRGAAIFATLAAFTDDTDEFGEKLKEIEGITKKTAKIIDDNLKGALFKVKSTLQDVLLSLGDLGAEEFLKEFFVGLANAFRAISANIGNVVAAVGVLIKVFIALKALRLAVFLLGIIGPLKLLFKIIKANPLGLLITAVAAVTSLMVGFQDQLLLTKEGTETVGDALSVFNELLDNEVTAAINSLGFEFEDFEDITDSVIQGVVKAFVFMLKVISGVIAAIKVLFKQDAKDAVKELDANLRVGVRKLFNFAKDQVNKFFRDLGRETDLIDTSEDQSNLKALQDAVKDLTPEIETMGAAFDAIFDTFDQSIKNKRLFRELEEFANLPDEFFDPDAPRVGPPPVLETGLTAAEVGLDKARRSVEDLEKALRSLEGSLFPLQDAFREEDKILKLINEARDRGIDLIVDEDELITRSQRAHAGLSNAKRQLAERIKELNRLRVDERASIAEVEAATRKATIAALDAERTGGAGIERAFLKLQDDAANAAKFTEKVFSEAFESVSDGITNLILGIEQDFGAFIRDLGKQLVKLGVQQALLGAGGFFPGAPKTPTTGFSGPGGFVADLFGFSHGGAFKVGATTAIDSLPGIDNRLVAFRARDGEEVTVTPKNSGPGAVGPTNIVFNVVTRDADSFQRSQSQLQNRALAGIAQARRRR